ncbi:I78 family peptidase inhibitor [Arenimonas composti]|uniref:Peptidase inhibitor I78 family protein n=1 Tax=Arenimonas composti TR7-09 = DSM 18010 TaxID=1121013 RepID=A0A091BCZ0_9GAMM|nr:I78 family peptidase inhibitor [Arenimonas composti]KFN48699.1 hypothetical protein P873_13665 [Arenimonas composti TR7-09 = DSM 18010]
MTPLRLPLLLLATAMSLGACASGPAEPPPADSAPAPAPVPEPEPTPMPRAEDKPEPAPATPSVCDSGPAAWAVGLLLDTNLIERIRVATGSEGVRVLKPGMMATMDYREDRVNIDVDGDDRVLRVRCG